LAPRQCRDVHLGEAQGRRRHRGATSTSILTFAVVALMILGMACINFTNLATARASAARPRSGAAQGAGCDAPPADRPVPRRIDPVAAIATWSRWRSPSWRCRCSTTSSMPMQIHYFGSEGIFCR
jgi:putative ABC transport system permease protein